MLDFFDRAAEILIGFNTMLFAGVVVVVIAALKSGLKRRKYFWPTFILTASAFCVFTNRRLAWPVYDFLNPFLGLTFALVYVILALLVWLWFDTDLVMALFLTICGYTIQHFLACFDYCLNVWIPSFGGINIVILLINILLLVGFYFVVTKPHIGVVLTSRNKWLYVIMTVITLTIICFLNYLYYLGGAAGVYLYICESVLSITLMLAQYGIVRLLDVQKQKEIMKYLLVASEKQRKMSEDNVEIINVKYHDLKRQIQAIKELGGNVGAETYIAETERAIDEYRLISKTGNKTLDTILTEKSFECNNLDISFTNLIKITDYALLDKIECMDLYMVLSNVLDNAIEAVKNIEPEKRIITLEMGDYNGFVKIHADNYCAEPPAMHNGYPVTTKTDKAYHGYGIRSMRMIAQKYNGNVVVEHHDNMFCIDIVFQIPDFTKRETD